MGFKEWIKTVFQRLGRLVTEMISVKVLVMTIVTFLYLQVKVEVGLTGFVLVIVGWFLVIGLRFAIKWTDLIGKLRGK